MTKLLQQCFLFFIVVVIPGHNLGNSQVSVNRTIGPTLVSYFCSKTLIVGTHKNRLSEAALMGSHNQCFEQNITLKL